MEPNAFPLSAIPNREGMDPGALAAIRRRANEMWQAEGYPQGRETEYWLRAELEILGQAPPLA